MITATVVTASLYPEYGATIQHVGDRDIQRIGPYTKRRPLSHAPTAAESKPAPKVKPGAAPTSDDLARMAENLRHQETADNELTETAAIDLNVVKTLMAPGEWWTLAALSRKVGAATQTVSARLRDLRKPRYGRNTVERRKTAVRGVFEYRLIIAKPEATDANS